VAVSGDTYRGIQKVLWITLVLNLLAMAAKLAVGYWTRSLSLMADGFDTLFDSASNVIGLIGIAFAFRPADAKHPYGHRKAETLTALIIAGLLFLTTWELAKSAVQRLLNPSLIHAEVTIYSFAALLFSMLIQTFVMVYELREGRRLKSDLLRADALHTRADLFISLSVIVGLVVVRLGFPLADPILAAVIAALIAKIGVDIIRESVPFLLDEAAIASDEITQLALAVPGVMECHRVRSRGREGEVFVDLHIHVDPQLSTAEAHAIAHRVQQRLAERDPGLVDVTIHVEPVAAPPHMRRISPPQAEAGVRSRIRELARQSGAQVHNIWTYEIEGDYYAEVHLELPGELALLQAHGLATAFERRAQEAIPLLRELITHIEPLGRTMSGEHGAEEEAWVRQTVEAVVKQSAGDGKGHDISLRRLGGGWSLSMHLDLPPGLKLAEAHRVTTRIESELRTRIPHLEQVTVHTEPAER
jgi:cation diffusion facilitator family transporter